jgi:ent-kaurene oxidase
MADQGAIGWSDSLSERLEQLEDPNFKPPIDLMQVVVNNGKKNGEGRDVDYQLNAIIGTGCTALFTASMTTFHTLYDLASRPEYIEPLLQEAAELGDAPLNRSNVGKLTKLNSFLRESQRWNMFMMGMPFLDDPLLFLTPRRR